MNFRTLNIQLFFFLCKFGTYNINRIQVTSTDYVNKNGGIGTGNKIDMYGKETVAITIVAVGDEYQGGGK